MLTRVPCITARTGVSLLLFDQRIPSTRRRGRSRLALYSLVLKVDVLCPSMVEVDVRRTTQWFGDITKCQSTRNSTRQQWGSNKARRATDGNDVILALPWSALLLSSATHSRDRVWSRSCSLPSRHLERPASRETCHPAKPQRSSLA